MPGIDLQPCHSEQSEESPHSAPTNARYGPGIVLITLDLTTLARLYQRGESHTVSTAQQLADLFRRDLTRLIDQLRAFPNDTTLWQTLPGITNSAGTLVLHLEGNLSEYIGRQLGHLTYQRQRDLEFSNRNVGQEELISRLRNMLDTIPTIIEGLTAEQLATEFPEAVLGFPIPTQQFLFQLYGHLNWHLGQIDYLRRALTGSPALVAATLSRRSDR